jgi:TAG lipase / steryl ester hydrolase / phospholipase A2 / LPA acyltransferase
LDDVTFDAFERKGSAGRKLWRLLSRGVLLDIKKLEVNIRHNVGDITFKEAYEKTKRILNITVSSTSEHEMPRLLNYLTSPNVLIWSAATASCALAFLYEPVCLMAKDEDGKVVPYHPSGLKWTDGSVETDLPMQRLSELFNINHFIVSQVNPHVLPFLSFSTEHEHSALGKLIELVGDEVRHRVTQISRLGFLRSLAVIVNQKYSGDITIVPDWSTEDYLRLFSNPDKDWMLKYIKKSERKTWAKLTQIRHSCAIELTLDRCMKRVEVELKKSGFKSDEANPYQFMFKKVYK